MKSSETRIFTIILIVAVVLVGFAVYPILSGGGIKPPPPPPPGPTTYHRDMFVKPGVHWRGDRRANTTIVVFSDFQCPSCAEGVPTVEEILSKKKGVVNMLFHHFQIRPDHNYSRILSRAAEAAGAQGDDEFWKMHDLLFQRQKDLVSSADDKEIAGKLRDLAKELNLDMIKFDATMAKKNDDPFELGNEIGMNVELRGTPTYFVIDPTGLVSRYNTTPQLQEWARKTDAKPKGK